MFKKSLLMGLIALSVLSQVKAEVTIKSAKPVEKSEKKAATTNNLDLSENKRKEVEKITNEHNQQLTQLRPQIKDKTKALKTELAKDNPELETLENLNKELFSLKEQEQLIRIKYQVALSRVLTADERKSLNKIAKTKPIAKAPQKAKNTINTQTITKPKPE